MRRTLLAVAATAALALSSCSVDFGEAGVGADGGADVRSSPLPTGAEPVAAVVDRVLPSVVNVTTDVFRTDRFGNPAEGTGVGTGFVVRPDGVIVTNCHVIEGANRITVSTSDDEPDRYEARVIGGDCENDLAILDVDVDDLPTVPLADSGDVRLGQQVVALGYALGLEGGPTVTTGIVSSLDRTIEAQDPGCDPEVCGPNQVRTYASVIQTDAAINPGNSGGPLVDMRGRVVGINSAGNDGAENIGFAIPIDRAKPVIERAVEEPLAAVAYLGVSTRAVTPELAFQLNLPVEEGAQVLATTGAGPAQDAGIEEGDVIVALSGEAVASPEDLGAILEGLEPGDRVTVELVGPDGDRRSVDVTLGTRPLPVDQIP
jgi:S1-C subfamily serine protease